MPAEVTLHQAGGSASATIPSEIARRFHLAPGDRVQAIATEHAILLLLSRFDPTVQEANWPVERHQPLQRWEQTGWVSRSRCVVLTIQRLAAGDLPWSELERWFVDHSRANG